MKRKQGERRRCVRTTWSWFSCRRSGRCDKTALLVGGGIGVPPLYELSRSLVAKGGHVIHILGFKTKDVVLYEEKFSDACMIRMLQQLMVHMVQKGFVTDVIDSYGIDFDILYSCGLT